jgi:large subunit ribosomal protein L21
MFIVIHYFSVNMFLFAKPLGPGFSAVKRLYSLPGAASSGWEVFLRMYAIVETGGKQFKVEEGDTLLVEKLNREAGETVELEKVLALVEDGSVTLGKPYVDGAKVQVKIVEHGKGKKILVFKYKPKKNYRRTRGHRQPYTKVLVESITGHDLG